MSKGKPWYAPTAFARPAPVLLLLLCVPVARGFYNDSRSAFVNGDFIIGVLLPVHEQPLAEKRLANQEMKCGKVREHYGIQRVEAAFWTLDNINKDSTLLPNLSLGIEIRDECWYAPIALRQSIEFIRDAITLSAPAHNDTCVSTERSNAKKGRLVGVVGPGASSVAVQVQNLLQLFQIPQIGYSSTSADLADMDRYNYFLRVVPTDLLQAQAMLDIVSYLGWKYVSIVNTGGNYGQSGIKAFQDLAEKTDVCIAQQEHVLSTDSPKVFAQVIENLKRQPLAKVVVCFCEGETVSKLFRAMKDTGNSNSLLIIGSDGWADRKDVVQELEEEAWGGISLRIRSPPVKDFDTYFKALRPRTNTRNPWFDEFWEDRFNCSLNESDTTRDPCTGNETYGNTYKQDAKLSFVVKAIMSLAYGLDTMQQVLCNGNSEGCERLKHFNGSLFKEYLMNVSFEYEEGDTVEFNQKGGPPGRYDILNYQKTGDDTYEYVEVGEWNNGSLRWYGTKTLQFGPNSTIESVCSKPCPVGQKKDEKQQGNDKRCCWTCQECKNDEILLEEDDGKQTCVKCKPGFAPLNATICYQLPIEFIRWTDKEAIIPMAFALLGFSITLFGLFIFVKHGQTPVVKSSTKELSYIILVGTLMAHASILAIIAKPSPVSCGLGRTLPGISFSMINAALLTKTNRIARILAGSKKKFPTRKPKFMSTLSQVFITCLLVMVETAISLAMLYDQPPNARNVYKEKATILECDTTREGVLAPLMFDFFLIMLCTLYAVKTRNVPENFNEAKFIGFAMYTTCVIWIAFVPIYFRSDLKVVTMCMCVTLSAWVVWVFLFLPKLYIIMLKPEKNNRTLFTTCKSIRWVYRVVICLRCHIGSKVSSAMPESTNSWRDSSTSNAIIRDTPSQRSLSCQTGDELLETLLKPKIFEHRNSPVILRTPRITEKSCCECEGCQIKKITIKLPAQQKTPQIVVNGEEKIKV